MPDTNDVHRKLAAALASDVAESSDANDAMEKVVDRLKRSIPDYNWVGIYLLRGNELVLGPFRGKLSVHTRIPLGRGICGAAATEKATIVVDDVNTDPRYLACSVETLSEIVVPIMRGRDVLGEIDVDSDKRAAFSDRDRHLLEGVAALLADKLAAEQSGF